MKGILYLSEVMIPLLIFVVLGWGILSGRSIYQDFLDGAKDGLKTVAGICPALIGLMTAVGILRASGFLDFCSGLLKKILAHTGVAPDLIPLALVRLFSSSAATGLLLDIFKEFGTDSRTGFTAAIMLGATESVFYCMSVYFGSVKVQKTRYVLPGALFATAAGIAAALWLGAMLA